MNFGRVEAEVRAALLAGTSRRPLPVELSGSPLEALSLAGQALRFAWPETPAHFAVELEVRDERRIVPERLRRRLLRLVGMKAMTEHIGIAVAGALERRRLRPHPFDLPRMEGFVRAHNEQLGAAAMLWVRPAAAADEEPAGYFDAEVLRDGNWTQAPLGRRAAYLERRREEAPAAGLALLEAVWAAEGADARVRLLAALAVGLGEADRGFLEGLAKDRAPRVKAGAARLLGRLGGGVNPALASALERIKRTETGFLRKRAVLTLEVPANVKPQGEPFWIGNTFAEISVGELARALGLDETELVAACARDKRLGLALALMGTADRRLDLLELVVKESLPEAWELIEQSSLRELALSAEDRLRWAGILAGPYGQKPPVGYPQWHWMHLLLRGAGPRALLEAALEPGWIAELPNWDRIGGLWAEVLAALCPPELRERLRLRLGEMEGGMAGSGLALMEFLDELETA